MSLTPFPSSLCRFLYTSYRRSSPRIPSSPPSGGGPKGPGLRPVRTGEERMVRDETNVERRGVNQTDEPALRVTRRSLRSLLTCPEGGFAASFVASHPACGAEGKGVG